MTCLYCFLCRGLARKKQRRARRNSSAIIGPQSLGCRRHREGSQPSPWNRTCPQSHRRMDGIAPLIQLNLTFNDISFTQLVLLMLSIAFHTFDSASCTKQSATKMFQTMRKVPPGWIIVAVLPGCGQKTYPDGRDELLHSIKGYLMNIQHCPTSRERKS